MTNTAIGLYYLPLKEKNILDFIIGRLKKYKRKLKTLNFKTITAKHNNGII